MSTLTLQERFRLDSPAELVWEHLSDPMRTVSCLPGAEITGQEDERTYSGTVKVKVGSVTVAYRGQVVFEEVDEAQRYIRAAGRGRERSGSGSVEMTMESRVVALDDGATEVTVDSEVRLTGRIVRFGRGMIDSVSAEIFKEFRTRLADALQSELAQRSGEAAAAGRSEGADGARMRGADGPHARRGSGATSAGGGGDDDAIALLPLLWRALGRWLRRLFGRG